MAIAPTGAIYKALKFDNVSSRTYGVYITGEAVYNAPERAVEMISIPGRSGAFALDQGRFENIEVSYPAGIFADNEADFAQAVSDFRNFLCSKKGYCRLTDEYNPNEYRMAVYKSGLEVDPAQLRAGEFTITFECKPQRWLTSGETAVAVASGGTLSNPTLFDASPLLEVVGYGDITVNSSEITVENRVYGEVLLANKTSRAEMPGYDNATYLSDNNLALMNSGDSITVMSGSVINVVIACYGSGNKINSITAQRTGGDLTGTISTKTDVTRSFIAIQLDSFNYAKGTLQTHTMSLSISVNYDYNGTTHTWSGTATLNLGYGGNRIYYNISINSLGTGLSNAIATDSFIVEVYGNSTKTITDPVYIDLDVGEAYINVNNTVSGVNNIVSLPANLPKLAPGANTITYDNTYTSFKVTPRWWKV